MPTATAPDKKLPALAPLTSTVRPLPVYLAIPLPRLPCFAIKNIGHRFGPRCARPGMQSKGGGVGCALVPSRPSWLSPPALGDRSGHIHNTVDLEMKNFPRQTPRSGKVKGGCWVCVDAFPPQFHPAPCLSYPCCCLLPLLLFSTLFFFLLSHKSGGRAVKITRA